MAHNAVSRSGQVRQKKNNLEAGKLAKAKSIGNQQGNQFNIAQGKNLLAMANKKRSMVKYRYPIFPRNCRGMEPAKE
jgi:hypothetical protein